MKIKLKLLILGILTAILVYLTLPSTYLTEKVYAANGGSTIAGVDVSGMDEKEIRDALNKAIEEWKTEPTVINGGGSSLEIDSTQVNFDIEGTIENYITMADKPWYAFWKKPNVVHIPLNVLPNDEFINQIKNISIWNTDETYQQFLTAVSNLKGHEVEAKVDDISAYENERLSLVIENIPSKAIAIETFAKELNEYVINPDETFSFIEVINDKIGNTDEDTINFVASVLYSSVLNTEFEIIERHQQKSIPSYVEPGKEAQVNLATNEDLKFYNNSGHVAVIKMSIENNKLKTEIYSDVKTKDVTVTVEDEVIKPRVITRYSKNVEVGKSALVQKGVSGLRINVYRIVSGDGETTDERISRSYYPPINRIIILPARTAEDIANEEVENADLNGDGLPDVEGETTTGGTNPNAPANNNEETLSDGPKDEVAPKGSYYDKAGNLVTQ